MRSTVSPKANSRCKRLAAAQHEQQPNPSVPSSEAVHPFSCARTAPQGPTPLQMGRLQKSPPPDTACRGKVATQRSSLSLPRRRLGFAQAANEKPAGAVRLG